MKHFLLLLTVLLATSSLAAPETNPPADPGEAWNRPVPEWWEGPVRYALTDGETRDYRSLSTPAERAAFIARFWAARDPSPFTPGNEAEETFWKRVGAADELFTATTISGWRTDRGRVYIVLGPPDEITNYPFPSVTELDPSHWPDGFQRWSTTDLRPGQRGAVEWIYRSLKSSRADAGQKVTFTRDETGEYRISSQLSASFRYEFMPGATALGRSGGGRRGNALARESGSGPVRGKEASQEPQVQMAANVEADMRSVEDMFAFGQAALFEKIETPAEVTGRVTTAQFFGVVPIQDRIDFFQATGGTAARITLGIPTDDLKAAGDVQGRLEIFGRLEKVGDPSHVYQFSAAREAAESVPVQDVGGREHHLYEVRGVIPPGEYQVNLGVRVGDRIGAVGDRVEVPDFGGEALRLSGPSLAEKIRERSEEESSKGFVVGQLRMLPKLEPVYRPGSDFGFYFQVYHAVPAPADGRLHLDIEYAVSSRQNGLFVPLGKPVKLSDNSSPAHAFILPLKGWNPGEYLLTVTVTDRVTLQVRSGSAPFLVQ